MTQDATLWYYARGEERLGPVPEPDLRALLAAGAVPSDAFVWAVGMAEWQRADSIPALAGSPSVPTPPPVPAASPTSAPVATTAPVPRVHVPRPSAPPVDWSEANAGAWRRYGARMLDLVWFAVVFWLIVGIVFAGNTTMQALANNTITSTMIVVLAASPLLAWCVHRFGTTLGKAILGIRVRRTTGADGLEYGVAFRRELEVVKWMAVGFPLVALFSMAVQHGRVQKNQHTSYDPPLGVVVEARELTGLRLVGAIVALVATVLLASALRMAGEAK